MLSPTKHKSMPEEISSSSKEKTPVTEPQLIPTIKIEDGLAKSLKRRGRPKKASEGEKAPYRKRDRTMMSATTANILGPVLDQQLKHLSMLLVDKNTVKVQGSIKLDLTLNLN